MTGGGGVEAVFSDGGGAGDDFLIVSLVVGGVGDTGEDNINQRGGIVSGGEDVAGGDGVAPGFELGEGGGFGTDFVGI